MKTLAKLSCGLIAMSGALVGLGGVAAADNSPEVDLNPTAETCLLLFGSYAGTPDGALRSPAQRPEIILICRLHAQQHL
jgi:hypothetical protein